MRPLVTIAIPTLGRLGLFREAFTSARVQTYSPIEILIGDNSGDATVQAAVRGTVEVEIAGLPEPRPEIRFLTQKSRLPMAEHWNALADAARGEFFVLLADDDLLEEGFVARMIELRSRAPEAGVLFSDHWIVGAAGEIDRGASDFYSAENHRRDLPSGPLADSAKAVWNSSVPICASLIETALLRKYRFNPKLNTPELDLFARLAASGVRFAYAAERLARYRVHGDSETATRGLRLDRLFRALRDIPVSTGAADARRTLLGNLLITAVTNAFLTRDMKTVREFLAEPLYPKNLLKRPVALLQKLAAVMPGALAASFFNGLYPMLRAIRGRSRSSTGDAKS